MQLVDHPASAEGRHLDVGQNEIDLAYLFGGNAERHRPI